MSNLNQLHEQMTREITEERNREMAVSIAEKQASAALADARHADAIKSIGALGISTDKLATIEGKLDATAITETEEIETRMNEESQTSMLEAGLDVEGAFLPDGAQALSPVWSAAFSDQVDGDQHTGSSTAEISTQAVLTGGGCKNYQNWAKGGGSGLFGTGVGKIQSWVEFGFWYKPPTSRFYTVRPRFQYRGYYIVKANDGFFTSKRAQVVASAWTNVHQYNWKGWNHVDVLNVSGSNINVNKRLDTDRVTHNSFLLGGGDWAYIRCTIGLYAYARGGGSYAKNDYSTGSANKVCVPVCHVY